TLAFRPSPAAVALGDRADDIQTQTGARHPRRNASAVETLENLLQLGLRKPRALIAHAYRNEFLVVCTDFNSDLRVISGVLHCVVDQIGNCRADLVQVRKNGHGRARLVVEGVRRQIAQRAGTSYAFLDQFAEVDPRKNGFTAAVADPSGP